MTHITDISLNDLVEKYSGRSGIVLIFKGRRAKSRDLESFETTLINAGILQLPFEHVFNIDIKITDNDGRRINFLALIAKDGTSFKTGLLFGPTYNMVSSIGVNMVPLEIFISDHKNS